MDKKTPITENQFPAKIQIDEMNLIGKLNSFSVPDPEALLVNKIPIDYIVKSNFSNYSLISEISHKFSEWSPGTFIGYNSIKFDEEVIRNAFFKNLFDPYLTVKNNNTRVDLLDITRIANFFYPDKIKSLLNDLEKFIDFLNKGSLENKPFLFNEIYTWIEDNLNDECIEYIVSMMMEPYDNIVNPLLKNMSADEELSFNIPIYRTVEELRSIIEKNYPDILKIDFSKNENNQNFWFISKNKEEPRLADRYKDHGSNLEQPLAIARDIKKLYEILFISKNSLTIGKFLMDHNEYRHVVRRAFITEKFPYAEIQDNTIGSNLMPIDMLRLKLSFFGALKFDPRSDKWLRICMFQGAPLPDELKQFNDNWIYNSLN